MSPKPKPKKVAKPKLKDEKGKFTVKIKIPDTPTDNEFIQLVQQELLAGYQDINRIKKAFRIIRGDELANMKLMKSVIMNYSA